MEISVKQLKVLLATLSEAGVGEFAYRDEKYKLRIVLAAPAGASTPARMSAARAQALVRETDAELEATPEEAGADTVFVTSPFVGTFYRAAAPESDPFVTPGSSVKPGQVLCIIEAMKLMNEIEAEFAGTIEEVLVENGKSVEFGQRLFRLRKG